MSLDPKDLGFKKKAVRVSAAPWGVPYGGPGPHYRTQSGLELTMRRKNQKTRFFDAKGKQIGPEQSNVAPAVAYAMHQRWTDLSRVPFTTDQPVSAERGNRRLSRSALLDLLVDYRLRQYPEMSRGQSVEVVRRDTRRYFEHGPVTGKQRATILELAMMAQQRGLISGAELSKFGLKDFGQ